MSTFQEGPLHTFRLYLFKYHFAAFQNSDSLEKMINTGVLKDEMSSTKVFQIIFDLDRKHFC